MSAEEAKPRARRRSRPLSEEERALWQLVTHAVRPLQATAVFGPAAPVAPEAAGPPVSRPVPAPEPKQRPQAALAPFDRRLKQRLARGVVAIDAVLDLHGLGLRDAHAALLSFVHRARTSDARVVLVITGKGGVGAPGVLRQQVPLWLCAPGLREQVLAFEKAYRGHGGEGALYVRLRRRRTDAP